MQVRNLLNDDDAVSPVIGVILMVAITVILAAVISSFVLGLGGSTTKTPTAKFTFEFDADKTVQGSTAPDPGGPAPGSGILTITHDGGDTIKASELYIRGSGFNQTDEDADSASIVNIVQNSGTYVALASQGGWEGNGDASAEKGGESAVASGDSINVKANNDYNIRVVWESSEGDSSTTLSQDTGPNTS